MPSMLTAVPPTVAIEIAKKRVCVVAIGRAAGSPVVDGFAAEPLPENAVVPSLQGVNIADRQVVAAALSQALERAGLRSTTRAALIVPDSVARVSLLPFEQVPARSAELDKLVRWQMRKATPFSLDDAQVSHFVASKTLTGVNVAAVVARRDVIAQYEGVADALGIHAGLVDLASFNVMNAVVASGSVAAGDWLLVHLASEATTLAIMRGSELMFYRHRPAVDEEPLSALVHQTAMYHEDRLGGGQFARVWLSGAAQGLERARQEIGGRLGVPVESVDIRPAASLRDAVAVSADLLDSLAAPVGVLLREQKAA
ncbi:MAG TPA: pilus assembly protein PilM [Vicinamibacterales bacterium]|nr:pilus assembly protein PilM [Vicinamibacterales bacterium]